MRMCVKHAFPRWGVCMEGKNELGKIPPRKTSHVRFGEDDMDKVIDLEGGGGETDDRPRGRPPKRWRDQIVQDTGWSLKYAERKAKDRDACLWDAETLWYLTMFLCLLWDLSVFLSAILCTCPVPEGFACVCP
ncbi:hypothetical protein Bbelb_332080 [Branchiostoma belcheri]|nr:hypothetical protein Bbelb_332080 [Branchiostoma belcheri]